MVPAAQTSSVAPSARDDGDGVTRQGGSLGRMISQHCRYRRRSRRHPVRLGRGPGHPRFVRAPHARENRRHPQRPMSAPHLANWLFLLPASLLGATIAGGRCLASLSVSLLFRLRRGSPKRSGGGRVMRKAPCREDGWLTKQGFEIVAHRAHLAGPPLRRCCREVKVSTPDRGRRNPSAPPSRPRVAPRSLS
jgi:hypothetical protein